MQTSGSSICNELLAKVKDDAEKKESKRSQPIVFLQGSQMKKGREQPRP